MKKICILFTILALFLVACKSDDTSSNGGTDKEPEQNEEKINEDEDKKEEDPVVPEDTPENETDNEPDAPVSPAFTKADKLAVVEEYYNAFMMRDYETAYNLLSEKTKTAFSKEDFLLWNQLLEATGFYRYTVSETSDENVFQIDSVINEYYWGDELRETYERSVVVENGEIKVEVLDWNLANNIAYSYDLLGLMYLDGVEVEQDYAKAEEYFILSMTYDPSYPYAHWDLGLVQERNGQLEEALESYNFALGLLPEDAIEDASVLLSNIGYVYQTMGDLETARAYYEQALEMDPNNTGAQNGLAGLGG